MDIKKFSFLIIFFNDTKNIIKKRKKEFEKVSFPSAWNRDRTSDLQIFGLVQWVK